MKRLRLLLGAGCALSVLQASAALGDFQPFASLSHIFDDNVFDERSDANVADFTGGDDQMYDNIFIGEAGFLADHQISRQNLFLRASINREVYVNYDELDSTGWDVLGGWDWAFGRRCSGLLSGQAVRAPNSFSERDAGNANLDVDEVDRFDGVLNGSCFVAPDVRVNGGGGSRYTEHGEDSQEDLNRFDAFGTAGVDWITGLGNSIGVVGRLRHSKFTDRQVGAEDDEHIQYYVGIPFEYFATRAITLSGDVGWTWRRHENLDNTRDFDDFHGNIAADFRLSGRTSVGVNVFRDVGGTENLTTSAQDDIGAEVDGTWLVTRRISLRGAATAFHRKFIGADANPADTNASKRQDDIARLTIGVDYQPFRNLTASLEYRGEYRHSNIRDNSYDSNALQTTLRVTF